MRDEVGGMHERGTLGISTRGPDTGDAQIFINLVDNPRLDFDYTVFARVCSGMTVVDEIVEGDRIAQVEVRLTQRELQRLATLAASLPNPYQFVRPSLMRSDRQSRLVLLESGRSAMKRHARC